MKQKGYVETQLQVATSMTVTRLTAEPSTAGYLTPMLDDAKCQDIWTKAVGGGNSLSYQKAGPYIKNLKLADPDSDGRFTKSEFIDACEKGLVRSHI